MIIPWQQLPEPTLRNIIEHFVLREGTEYGAYEMTLEQKVEQVLAQIKARQVVIFYSELHDSIDLRPATAL